MIRSLKSIIDRAEMDLKSKAEAVLSSTFSDSFTGLTFTFLYCVFFDHRVQFCQPFVGSSRFFHAALHLPQAPVVPAQ
jgi:hypothetical protein